MIEVRQSEVFASWINSIRDSLTKARILVRIDRLQLGLIGDSKLVGGGVSELRINFGPGYRIYFAFRGRGLILLLIGGNKSSQNRDIRKAQILLKKLDGGKYAKN